MFTKSGGETEGNTLATWTDRNLKVQQKQIHSIAPGTEEPQVQQDRLGTNWLESFAERGLQQTEHESAAHPCREEG